MSMHDEEHLTTGRVVKRLELGDVNPAAAGLRLVVTESEEKREAREFAEMMQEEIRREVQRQLPAALAVLQQEPMRQFVSAYEQRLAAVEQQTAPLQLVAGQQQIIQVLGGLLAEAQKGGGK